MTTGFAVQCRVYCPWLELAAHTPCYVITGHSSLLRKVVEFFLHLEQTLTIVSGTNLINIDEYTDQEFNILL
jgi:hypothetical protein